MARCGMLLDPVQSFLPSLTPAAAAMQPEANMTFCPTVSPFETGLESYVGGLPGASCVESKAFIIE